MRAISREKAVTPLAPCAASSCSAATRTFELKMHRPLAAHNCMSYPSIGTVHRSSQLQRPLCQLQRPLCEKMLQESTPMGRLHWWLALMMGGAYAAGTMSHKKRMRGGWHSVQRARQSRRAGAG